MGRFANSMALAKSSWSVLKADKMLMAIPVASFVVTTIVVAVFGGAVYLTIDQTPVPANGFTASTTEIAPTPVTYVVGVVAYLVITFVVTYFAAALVAGAWERLNGGSPTLASSFATANRRIGPIAGWALLSGTIGLVIQALEERLGFIGQLLGGLVGMAWRLVTWLAIPVIVVEGTGPWPSLKRAASLFKQTWGENIIAAGGFGLIGFGVMLVGVLISAVFFAITPIAGAVIFAIWVAVTATVIATLNGIYRTALYAFAAGHQISWFDQEQLATAFKPKKGILR